MLGRRGNDGLEERRCNDDAIQVHHLGSYRDGSSASRISSPASPLLPTHPSPSFYQPRVLAKLSIFEPVLQDQSLGAEYRKARATNIPEPIAPFDPHPVEGE